MGCPSSSGMGARDDDDQMPIFAPLSAHELSPLSRSRRISDQFQHMQFSPASASAEVLQVQEARMPILRTVDGTPLQLQPTLRSSLGSRGRRRRRGHGDGERRKPDGDEATDGTHSETCSPDSSENSTSSLDHRSGGSIPASLIFTCQPPSPASTMMCKSLGPSGGPTVLLSTAPGVGPVGRACLPDLILSQLSEETEACDYDDDNDCLDASIAGSITLEHLETDDAIERAIQLRMAQGPHGATDGPGGRPGAGGEDSGNSRSCFRLNNKDQNSHGNNNKSLRFLDQVSDRSLITHEHTIPRVTSVDVEALYYSETDLANFREEYAVEKALERAAGQFCMSQERMSGPKRRGSGPRRPRNVGPVDSDHPDSRPTMPSRDEPELNGGRRSKCDSPPRPRSRGMTRQSGMRNLGLRGSIRVLSAADLADSSSDDDDDDDDSTDSDDRPSKSDEEEKANQIDISKLRGRPGRLDFPLSVPLSVRTRAQVGDD